MQSAKPNLAYVSLIAAAAAIGGFLFGFDSAVINGTIEALQASFKSDTAGTGFSVASILLGSALGALLAGPIADRFGRKQTMLITAVVFAVGAWGAGAAADITEFTLYRLLGGLAVGAASVVSPAYISEIAPAQLRGRLASLQQLGIVVGIALAFVSNYVIARIAGSAEATLWFGYAAWRWMFWMEILPSVVFGLASLLIP